MRNELISEDGRAARFLTFIMCAFAVRIILKHRSTKEMGCLTEGTVRLTRPHNGPGVLVHSERSGAFVTLKCASYVDLEALNNIENALEGDNVDTLVRVIIGKNDYGLVFRVPRENCGVICSDLWVNAGDEVWISTSRVGKHVIFGYTVPK